MTRAPWTTPVGTRLVGAVFATIEGRERQVASAAGQAPQFDEVADVGRALADNAGGIAALRNVAPALIGLWDAVANRHAARCWSRPAATNDPACLCGAYAIECPCTIADVAVAAAFDELGALP